MDSPLKCFNQVLSSRLSCSCSNNELLGYLITVLYYSSHEKIDISRLVNYPLHISVARSFVLKWIDTELNELNCDELIQLRVLVLDILTRIERAGFHWLYQEPSIYSSYKSSSIMDHSTGLSEEAGCLFLSKDRYVDIFGDSRGGG